MPKVTPDYYEKKKDMIVDAAFDVCKRKPMHQVTMKDIIRETGLSQGGIYRYFKNVDEIFVEVMNKCTSNKDYKQLIDCRIKESSTSKDAVKLLLSLLAEYINDNATTLGKFHFEITELIAYEPERLKTLMFQNLHVDNTQYFMKQLYAVIHKGIVTGEFTPDLSIGDIFGFLSTSIDGIVLDGILHKCYHLPEQEYGFDIQRLMDTLARSMILLLSPDHKKTDQ